MNERIRELIEECTDRHFSEGDNMFETFDKEKFAELIVGECIDQFCRRGAVSADGGIVMEIKEHFGVE